MVFAGGQHCPIVGRVSMERTAIDVTDANVKRNDWAEFFGSHISVDEAAGWAGIYHGNISLIWEAAMLVTMLS